MALYMMELAIVLLILRVDVHYQTFPGSFLFVEFFFFITVYLIIIILFFFQVNQSLIINNCTQQYFCPSPFSPLIIKNFSCSIYHNSTCMILPDSFTLGCGCQDGYTFQTPIYAQVGCYKFVPSVCNSTRSLKNWYLTYDDNYLFLFFSHVIFILILVLLMKTLQSRPT